MFGWLLAGFIPNISFSLALNLTTIKSVTLRLRSSSTLAQHNSQRFRYQQQESQPKDEIATEILS